MMRMFVNNRKSPKDIWAAIVNRVAEVAAHPVAGRRQPMITMTKMMKKKMMTHLNPLTTILST